MGAGDRLPALIRLPALGALLVCSIVVLGIDAHIVSVFQGAEVCDYFGDLCVSVSAPTYAKLGLAVAVITIVTVVPMIVLDFLRKGVVTSHIAFELGWFFVLWVLWLAAAGETASVVSPGCDAFGTGGVCSEPQAAEAFSFLAWLVLLFYWVILLVFTLLAYNRGHKQIWNSSVSDHEWSSGTVAGTHNEKVAPAPTGQSFPATQQTGTTATTYPPTHNQQAPV